MFCSNSVPGCEPFLRFCVGQVMWHARKQCFVITSLVRKFQTALVSRCVNEFGGIGWPIAALVLQCAHLILQSTTRDKWSGPPSILHCSGSAYLQWWIGGSGYESFPALTTSPKSLEPVPTPLHCTAWVEIAFQRSIITSVLWGQILIEMQAKTVWQRMFACNRVDVNCAIKHPFWAVIVTPCTHIPRSHNPKLKLHSTDNSNHVAYIIYLLTYIYKFFASIFI